MSAVETNGNAASQVGSVDTQLAIEVRDVKKVYGSTIALAGVELKVRPGQIHGLLGENGAGKSTLVRLLAGLERPDGGTLEIFGEEIGGDRSFDARGAGCAFIHQDLALFPTASVAENIGLTKGYRRRAGLIDDRATLRDTRELLDRLDMRLDPTTLVGELPLADQTAVAIARALSEGVRLIVLDEPTAYLEERQAQKLMTLLRRLRDEGVACLLITHRASDVLDVCDCLTVLRGGETVAAGRSAVGMSEDELVRIISGHEPIAATPRTQRVSSTPVFELRDVAGPGFDALSLQVGEGEIVGLCGLADAGTEEVSRVTFGIEPVDSGEMLLDGRPVTFRGIRDAIRAKVGYVPRERRAAGLAESMTVRENLFLRNGRWRSPIQARGERRRATALLERFGVRPNDPERDITTLSGGNQQKVIVAKWCTINPRFLVLNEPTAGVDLGAKAEIHSHIRRMCETEGCGVLLISSDFSEVAELADRVYVMHRRHMFKEIDCLDVTAHRLVTLAYGRDDE